MSKKQKIAIEIATLKQQLRERERERERVKLWTGSFWWWILFWPVLIYKCVKKSEKGAKLDIKIRDLRERIQILERKQWELEK